MPLSETESAGRHGLAVVGEDASFEHRDRAGRQQRHRIERLPLQGGVADPGDGGSSQHRVRTEIEESGAALRLEVRQIGAGRFAGAEADAIGEGLLVGTEGGADGDGVGAELGRDLEALRRSARRRHRPQRRHLREDDQVVAIPRGAAELADRADVADRAAVDRHLLEDAAGVEPDVAAVGRPERHRRSLGADDRVDRHAPRWRGDRGAACRWPTPRRRRHVRRARRARRWMSDRAGAAPRR